MGMALIDNGDSYGGADLPLPSAVRHYTLSDIHPPEPSVDDLLVTIAYLQRRNEELTANLTACQERCTALALEKRELKAEVTEWSTQYDHDTQELIDAMEACHQWAKRWKGLAKQYHSEAGQIAELALEIDQVVANIERDNDRLREENDTLRKALDKAKTGVAKCQG